MAEISYGMGDSVRIIQEGVGMSSVRLGPAARSGFMGLIIGLAIAGYLGSGRPQTARAATQSETNGTIAFTTAGQGTAQWLYLVDTRNQSFAVYRVEPQNPKGAVKLEAARQYGWDLKLAEYNNQPPDVAAIESMVGQSKKR
jgi:hypothetical protein